MDLVNQRRALSARCLIIEHYAGHAVFENDVLYFVVGLFSNQRISYARTLSTLIEPDTVIPSTDSLLILDCCYSDSATRASSSSDYSAEVVAFVDASQKAYGNPSDSARVINKTFTSRFADEIAREIERGTAVISVVDIIAKL